MCLCIHVVYIWYMLCIYDTHVYAHAHTRTIIYVYVYVYYVHIHPHAHRNAHIHTQNMWSRPRCECDFEGGAQIYMEDTGVEFERLNWCVENRTRVCQDLPYGNPIRPRMETSHSSSHSTNRWCVVKCVWEKWNETNDKSQRYKESHHITLQCRWCSNCVNMCVCDCPYLCLCLHLCTCLCLAVCAFQRSGCMCACRCGCVLVTVPVSVFLLCVR